MTLIITSYVISCICLIIVIINAFRISKLRQDLIESLEINLKLTKELEKMAKIIKDHTYMIDDHSWALDCIYELFNIQKDINLRVRNSIDLLSDDDEPRKRWAEDDMIRILHKSFLTRPDQVEHCKRWRKPSQFKKTEKEKAENGVKNVKPGRKSTKNCVK